MYIVNTYKYQFVCIHKTKNKFYLKQKIDRQNNFFICGLVVIMQWFFLRKNHKSDPLILIENRLTTYYDRKHFEIGRKRCGGCE